MVQNEEQKIKPPINDYIHPLIFTSINWQMTENLNHYLEQPIEPAILENIVHQAEYIELHDMNADMNKLKVSAKVIEIKKHRRGTKMAIKFEYFSGDIKVATEFSAAILFGVKLKGDDRVAEKMPWPEKIEGQAIWTAEIKADARLPYRYAEKTKIDAAIHTDPAFARSIGLPDIILQGSCSFAKAINEIVSREINGDYKRIKGIAARFTGHVVVPEILEIKTLKKSNKKIHFRIDTRSGKSVIKAGQINLK